MASAKFLEEALSTDVDESAVNAIVGSLENQLVTSTPSVSTHNSNVGVINQNVLNSATSNGSSVSVQKFGISNGDTLTPLLSSDQTKIVSTANFQTNATTTNIASTTINNIQGSPSSNFVGQISNVNQTNLANMQKGHEPVKLICSQSSQGIANSTTININNRVTFPAQTLPNGSIGIASIPQTVLHTAPPGTIVSQGVNKTVPMQSPLVIKGNATGPVGMQSGIVTVPMSVNTNMTTTTLPGVMSLTKPANQNVATTQNIVGSGQTLLPNVQILNMRPAAPGVTTQKTVAAVSPRVVIGTPQVMGARAGTPGITLQTIPGLQPGQQGHLLLKTENGQYQLLRVGPAPAQGAIASPPTQTIRLSTVPAQPGSVTVSTTGPTMATAPAGVPQSQVQTQQVISQPVMAAPMPAAAMPISVPSTQVVTTSQPQVVPSMQVSQKLADNAKEKCRNFLANLLDLSSREPATVERNVRILIQELIDSRVEPEQFCDRLEKLLNASPQPCLIGFLKKSLPLLRQSLVNKELVIDGIQPPMAQAIYSQAQTTPMTLHGQVPPIRNSFISANNVNVTRMISPNSPIMLPQQGIIQNQQPSVNIVNQTTIIPPQVRPVTTRANTTPSGVKPGTVTVLQNIPVQTNKMTMNRSQSGKIQNQMMQIGGKTTFAKPTVPVAIGSPVGGSSMKSSIKEKEKRSSMSFAQSFLDTDKMAGDDDINDVAAMGGVNLAEESQRILGSTELIGTQIRSCKDEYFAAVGPLQYRFKQISAKHGLEEPSADLSALVSHAVQERLKSLVEKLAIIAEHRIDLIKMDPRYEVSQDVKGQLKFLCEIDRVGRKRREDSEREILLRAARSRSKTEDPEQAKLKAKAKEMQRAEMEELRQREANLTALQAIGTRKKPRLGDAPGVNEIATPTSGNGTVGSTANGGGGRNQVPQRSRLKRVNYRDMIFLLEQERDTSHSTLIYKCYLK